MATPHLLLEIERLRLENKELLLLEIQRLRSENKTLVFREVERLKAENAKLRAKSVQEISGKAISEIRHTAIEPFAVCLYCDHEMRVQNLHRHILIVHRIGKAANTVSKRPKDFEAVFQASCKRAAEVERTSILRATQGGLPGLGNHR